MYAISRLLKPRSVAVIGASADASKTAGRPVSYLLKHGFAGGIYPVNPKADRIGDLTCYPDVASLPEVPDVGIVLLGAERAHLAVREFSARGTAAAIVLASGYTETRGRLVSVSPICQLRWTSGGRPPTIRESGDMDCAEAQSRAPAEHAQIINEWNVAYVYVSPVDRRTYRGVLRTGDPLYSQRRPGDEIEILAHKSEAGKSRERALLD